VAIGGAGLMSPSGPLLREFVFSLSARQRPRVLYLPTASGDAAEGIAAFYEAYPASRCHPNHLPLFVRKAEDLRPLILEQDVIFVGGGNTANMLAIWRLHGVDTLLKEAWEAGTIMCGSSAGSLCWFEAGITDSFGPQLAQLPDGLGFLAGSNCPHYDSEVLRRPVYRAAVESGFPPGLAAEDAVGLHFVDRAFHEAITAKPGGRAFRVECPGGEVSETAIPARYIG